MHIAYPGTREPGGGGGAVGATWGNPTTVGATPQLGSCWGAAPQFWIVNVVNLYFCLFLHVNLGLSQK